MSKSPERIALERAFEQRGIAPDAVDTFVAAVDHAGLELRNRGGEKRAEIVGSVKAQRLKVCGQPGGYLFVIPIPGRGWLVSNERQCCRGRNLHCDPPIFIAGDGGALLEALPDGGES